MIQLPMWVEYVRALGAPAAALVAALLAGVFAYRQWLTAQNKLKLDLFDRRFVVYKAASDLIQGNSQEEEQQWETVDRLTNNINTARWLLDEAAHDELQQLIQRVKDQRAAHAKLETVPPNERGATLVESVRTWRHFRTREMDALDRLFTPYLTLRH